MYSNYANYLIKYAQYKMSQVEIDCTGQFTFRSTEKSFIVTFIILGSALSIRKYVGKVAIFEI